MAKLKNDFSFGCPKKGGFAGDRLGIGRCEGGPGVPLMLRSQKLPKRASDPEGPKMGFPKIAPQFFLYLWLLANGPKMGGAKSTPHICPLSVSCP